MSDTEVAHLSNDVLRILVPKLSLWDARSLQLAHPCFARIVHEVVKEVVERAMMTELPSMVDRFLNTRPGFQERIHHDFILFRTPKDLTVQYVRDRVCVSLRMDSRHGTRVELRVQPDACWPTFPMLERALGVLWWYSKALHARGVSDVEFRTKASVHKPTSEVLNMVAGLFVDRHAIPLLTQ